MKPEDLEQNLDITTCDVCSAFLALCDAVFKAVLSVPKVAEESQQAAEALAKTIVAGFGLSPATVHDLNELAAQLENAYRGRTRDAKERRRFAAAIRALDGNTEAARGARYHRGSVEPLAQRNHHLPEACAQGATAVSRHREYAWSATLSVQQHRGLRVLRLSAGPFEFFVLLKPGSLSGRTDREARSRPAGGYPSARWPWQESFGSMAR